MGTGLDVLAIGNYMLFKHEQRTDIQDSYTSKYETGLSKTLLRVLNFLPNN